MKWVGLIAGAVMAGGALAQGFVPAEKPATSNKRLLDPEFNQAKNLVTWVDLTDGSIWLSGIDPATGTLIPETGKGTLIEQGAAGPGGLTFTVNGPEWALGSDGDAIVYTRVSKTQPKNPALARIGASFQDPATGQWVVRTVSAGVALNAPFGSDINTDKKARITYNDAYGNHYWRELRDASTEQMIPDLTPDLVPAIRHVRSNNNRRIVYPNWVGGIRQVFWYDPDKRVAQQITFDDGDKNQPWIWKAPDYNGNLVMASLKDGASVAMYEQVPQPQGGFKWTKRHELHAPVEGARFYSVEPFEYGGKSYALMQLIVTDYPTSIWLAGFDPAQPFLRRLTPEAPDRARADPEIYFTDKGPIVFFSRFNQNKGDYWLCAPCTEGLFRAETGIPAVPAATRK